MSDRDRVVIIGAGHNGLTAAAYLAREGREVIVLEARDRLGGLAALETFGDGYRVPGLLHDTHGVRQVVVEELDLGRYGLRRQERPTEVLASHSGGEDVRIRGDEVAGAIDPQDAERFAAFRTFIGKATKAMRPLLDEPPLHPLGPPRPLIRAGGAIRRMRAGPMMELLRIGPMAVADWMRDAFRSPRLQAAVAAPALEGSFMGPWSAGSAANLLLREVSSEAEVVGGPAALIEALTAAVEAHGGQIRTGAVVSAVRLGGGRVQGVTLEDGETIDAPVVAASCDPKQLFLRLIGSHRLPVRLAGDVEAVRARGTTAKVHLALSEPPAHRSGLPFEAMITGDDIDDLERAFDAVKYRGFSASPLLEVRVPSLSDPTLAPAGHHVASVLVHFAAYDMEGGWSRDSRQALSSAVIQTLVRHCPNVRGAIVAGEVLTPTDLEARYRVTRGHIHHGEHAPDQLLFMRPTIQCSRYATPIAGLYLCGSGSHPGGGITCMPGRLGAKAILAA